IINSGGDLNLMMEKVAKVMGYIIKPFTDYHEKATKAFEEYEKRNKNNVVYDRNGYANHIGGVNELDSIYKIISKTNGNYNSLTNEEKATIKNKLTNGFGTSSYDDILESLNKEGVTGISSIDRLTDEDLFEILSYIDSYKKSKSTVSDGLLSSNGSSMLTAASNVTPIHDGSVQLAKSDPKDSAIFAKTGGPFDTLFNGIFAKINEVSEILPKSMLYNMPIDIRKSLSESLSHSKDTTNNSYNQTNPIKIELNGKLELTNGNGQSVDIINTIKNNPMLLRQLTELISQSINENIYGGRTTFNAGVTTPRFKSL
ncbi:MAG: hypothetical protein K2H20_00015, partial [Bacilli bacterium]|nr:hypothetical protein [Bacilli bacterium]